MTSIRLQKEVCIVRLCLTVANTSSLVNFLISLARVVVFGFPSSLFVGEFLFLSFAYLYISMTGDDTSMLLLHFGH